MHTHDRLFMLVDPATRRLVGLCTGPDDDGSCSSTSIPTCQCGGLRVVPLRGTRARGLPFTVTRATTGTCPLAWVDRPLTGLTAALRAADSFGLSGRQRSRESHDLRPWLSLLAREDAAPMEPDRLIPMDDVDQILSVACRVNSRAARRS